MIILVGSPLWPVYQNIAITPLTHVWIVSMNFVQRLFQLEKDASDRNLSPEYATTCADTNKAILYFWHYMEEEDQLPVMTGITSSLSTVVFPLEITTVVCLKK